MLSDIRIWDFDLWFTTFASYQMEGESPNFIQKKKKNYIVVLQVNCQVVEGWVKEVKNSKLEQTVGLTETLLGIALATSPTITKKLSLFEYSDSLSWVWIRIETRTQIICQIHRWEKYPCDHYLYEKEH